MDTTDQDDGSAARIATLYARLRTASGLERRSLLTGLEDALQQLLLLLQRGDEIQEKHAVVPTIIAGLEHTSNDVRRIVLGVIANGVEAAAHNHRPVCFSLQQLLAPIVAAAWRAVRAATTSLSAVQAAGQAAHALTALLLQSERQRLGSTLAATDVQTVAEVALAIAAVGLAHANSIAQAPSSSSARTSLDRQRRQPGAAFSFDRTASRVDHSSRPGAQRSNRLSSAFADVSLRKQTSSSSLRSLGGSSVAVSDYESEHGESITPASDVDKDHADSDTNPAQAQRRLAAAQRIARRRAIGCLDALNTSSPKHLLIKWADILCESRQGFASLMDVAEHDSASSNRVTSCYTLEQFISTGARLGFFAGAEERRRMPAFTPLSSRIASTIVHLRLRLNRVLLRAQVAGAIPSTAVGAALRCARVLVDKTAAVKLLQTHAVVLQPAALHLCSSKDPSVAIPAYALLSGLSVGNNLEGLPDLQRTILPTLQSPAHPLSVKADAWTAIAASLDSQPPIASQDFSQLLTLAEEHFASPSTDGELQKAVAHFVLAVYRSSSAQAEADKLLAHMCRDQSPTIRALAAECTAFASPSPHSLLRSLMSDKESNVRAAAVRSLGVQIQSGQSGREGVVLLDGLQRGLEDQSLLVRMRASWSLGNLCEALRSLQHPGTDTNRTLLDACLELRDNDERVALHAIRGAGALLALAPLSELSTHRSAVGAALLWLLQTITKAKDPKLRWNACSSLGRAFGGASHRTTEAIGGEAIDEASLGEEGTARTLFMLELASVEDSGITAPGVLAHVLSHEKTFKTRLAACTALTALLETGGEHANTKRLGQGVISDVQKARTAIIDEIPLASFREAQLHAIPLQKALDKLAAVLQLDDEALQAS